MKQQLEGKDMWKARRISTKAMTDEDAAMARWESIPQENRDLALMILHSYLRQSVAGWAEMNMSPGREGMALDNFSDIERDGYVEYDGIRFEVVEYGHQHA